MDIKTYRDIKRRNRTGYRDVASKNEMTELLKLLDDYRDFNNHLLAYITMGFSTKFKTLYDVKDAAIALHDRLQ